jgi:hypothetical protein
MYTGEHQAYYWIEHPDVLFHTLISEFPELVLDRYLIITSFDSGPLVLGELDRGWHKHGDLAISPRISNTMEIPYDQYDEWYIFQTLPALTVFNRYQVFVNYVGFSLQSPMFKELQEMFWNQLEEILPEAFVAGGDNLLLVTKNLELFKKIERWMSAP